MSIPQATLSVLPSGLGLVTLAPDQVHVVMGPSSKGTLLTPFSFSSIAKMTTDFGCGPAIKAAAYAMAKVQGNVIFVRLPATTIAATKSAVTKTGTGTFVATLAGTPVDAYNVVVVFTLGGTLGTGPISYKVSVDGGVNFGSVTSLGTATTIADIGGTGVTVNFTSTQTIVTNDQIEFITTPASQSILPLSEVVDAGTTAGVAVSGTPEDEYDVVFEILNGGTVGTAGIEYRYSLDGGNSYTPRRYLGTADNVDLLDGKSSAVTADFQTSLSGMNIDLDNTSTLTTGDVFSWKTTGPAFQGSDVTTAIAALKASSHKWSFLHIVGDSTVGASDSTIAGTVGTEMANLAAGTKYTWSALSARGKYANEPESDWTADLLADFQSYADNRIGVGGGMATITCPVTGRRNRRPVMWIVVPRLLAYSLEVDPGRKLSGPLSSDVKLHDSDNLLVEHDARIDSTLHDARFVTLRTYEDSTGLYVTRGNLMETEGGDFDRIAYRRVMDKASVIFRRVMEAQLENDLFVNNDGSGTIREVDLGKIDREIKSALTDNLLTTGQVSAISVQCSRTDDVLTTKKLSCVVKIAPKAYIDTFEGEIGFTSAALAELQTA